MSTRAYPFHGFAPGNYNCQCLVCGKMFVGAKRAFQCEPCAEKVDAKINGANLEMIGPAYENTDDACAIDVLEAVRQCAASHDGASRILGNIRACDIVRAIDVAMNDWPDRD